QPKGETEMNVDQLRAQFDKIMHPEKAVAAAEKQAAADAESAEKAAAEKAAAEKTAAEQAKAPAVTPEAAAPSQEAKPAEPKAPAPAKKGGQNGNAEPPAADNNTDGVSA
ncbi:MAG: insulinase family protein, partial [Morganella morganii]